MNPSLRSNGRRGLLSAAGIDSLMVGRFGKVALLSLLAVGLNVLVPAMASAQDPDDDKVHNTPPPDPAEEVKKFQSGLEKIADFGIGLIGGTLGGGGGGGILGKSTKVYGSLGFTHSGSIKRAGRNPNQAFLGDAGVFSLNALDLVVDKAPEKDKPDPGVYLRLLDGDVKQQLFARGGSLAEAYGYRDFELFGLETDVQFGQFQTPITFEDFPIGTGISKPSGYQFLVPKLSRGARATHTLAGGTKASLMLLAPLENGVFSRRPPMLAMGFETGSLQKQATRLFLGLQRSESGWGQGDSLAGLSHRRSLSTAWTIAADLLRNRSSDVSGVSADHRGYSMSTTYSGTRNARVLARWDLVEGGGASTPWGPRSFDGLRRSNRVQSLTMAWTLPGDSPNTRSQIELRRDWAGGGLYGDPGNPVRNQSTWTFAQVFAF